MFLYSLVLTQLVAVAVALKGRYERTSIALSSFMMLLTALSLQAVSFASLPWFILMALVLLQFIYGLWALWGVATAWRMNLFLQPLLLPWYLFVATSQQNVALTDNPWTMLHLLLGVWSFAVLGLATLAAFVVITRFAYLKAQASSGFSERLPSLQAAERGEFIFLCLGTFLLAAALAAGELSPQLGVTGLEAKKTLAYILLGILVVICAALMRKTLWGKLAARLILLIFPLIVLITFGRMLLAQIHF